MSGGCGCFAFVIGAALAVALFAPQLLSGYGARVIEKYLGGKIDGTIEVSGVTLFWGEQQSADIRVLSPDGKQVLQGSIDFPPLLDLVGNPETEQRYKVTINKLNSTIFEDGSSTLGQTFGVGAGDGETVIRRLVERATSELKGIRSRKPEASIKVTVRLREALIRDIDSGRGNLAIENAELEVGASAVDARVILRNCRVEPEGQPAVDVEFATRFGRRQGGQEELLAAKFDAGPLSVATLQTLGILPRTLRPPAAVDRRIELDLFDRCTPGLFGLAEDYFKDGAAVRFTYGGLQPMDARAPSESVPLTLRLDNDAGFFDMEARVQLPDAGQLAEGAATAAIVGELRAGGEAAIFFKARTAAEPLIDVVNVITPPGNTVSASGVALAEGTDAGPTWSGRVKSLRIPFDRSCLRIGEYGDGLFGAEPARAVVAAALRRTECQLEVASVGSAPAVVTVAPSDQAQPLPEDTLTLRHLFTSVTLLGRVAGKFESQWFTEGEDSGVSFVRGSLPGDPILVAPEISDYPDGKLELQVTGVPRSVLGSFVAFPTSFASLLPKRFDRIVLRDLPLRFVLGVESRDPELELEVWTDRNERLAGTYVSGEFTCPKGALDIPLGEEAQKKVLMRLMPWFEGIEPVQGGGQLDVAMENFVFRLEEGAEKESGRMTIDSPPLRVKLDRRLVRQLRLGKTLPGGWIEWDPAPMVLDLDGATTRYQFVELPLGGGNVSAMSGFETTGRYNLSTTVERRFLRHLSKAESGATDNQEVAVVIDKNAEGRLSVNVSPAEFATVLESIGDILSPEKRRELFEKFGLTEDEDDR